MFAKYLNSYKYHKSKLINMDKAALENITIELYTNLIEKSIQEGERKLKFYYFMKQSYTVSSQSELSNCKSVIKH